MKYFRWAPDRELNPHYNDILDLDKACIMVAHKQSNGIWCMSELHFNNQWHQRLWPNDDSWNVHSWEPLTITPSILCTRRNDHGYITNGKWMKSSP